MSLTRRIAKSALLTAAGAASVVGVAVGSANAAELPSNPDVGGLSNQDNQDGEKLGQGVDISAPDVPTLVDEAGLPAFERALPLADDASGNANRATTHNAPPTDELTAEEREGLGLAAERLKAEGLPTEKLTALLKQEDDSPSRLTS